MKKFLVLILLSIPAAAQQQSGVQYADRFFGTDVCKRIQAAIQALPLIDGRRRGIVEAENFKSGIQACTGGLAINEPVELRLGAYILQLGAPLDIRKSGTVIRGTGWEHDPPRINGTVIRPNNLFTAAAVIRVAGGFKGDDVSGAKIQDLQVDCQDMNRTGIALNGMNANEYDNPLNWAVFGTIDHVSVYKCQTGLLATGPFTFDWSVTHSRFAADAVGIHLARLSNAFRFIGDEVDDNTQDGYLINGPAAGNAILGGDIEGNYLNNIHLYCDNGHVDGTTISGVYFEIYNNATRDLRFENCTKPPGEGQPLYRGVSITGSYFFGSNLPDYAIETPAGPKIELVGFNFSGNVCHNYLSGCIHNNGGAMGTIGSNFAPKLSCPPENPTCPYANHAGVLAPNANWFSSLDSYGNTPHIDPDLTLAGNVSFGRALTLSRPLYLQSVFQTTNIEVPDGNLPVWMYPGRNVNFQSTQNATSSGNLNSPLLSLFSKFWNGSASAADVWSFGGTLAAGTNPLSTLVFGHSGSAAAHIDLRSAQTLRTNAIDAAGPVNATSLNTNEKGFCTLGQGAPGACSPQHFVAQYSFPPSCFGNWTGVGGTLTGVLKMSSTTTDVTPASTVTSDTSQISYVCFGTAILP